jgi:spore coat protein U-like protein
MREASMSLKSVLRILGIATLQTGMMCSPGLAATRTTSLSITATVVAGCRVSSVLFAAQSAVSESKGRETIISMNCSLPVPYQISVITSARTDPTALGLTRSDFAGPSSYALTNNLRNRPDDSIEEPNNGLARLLFVGLPVDSINVRHCTAEDTHSETITVIITY